MATLAQIRTAVDNRLAALWPTIQAKQDNYFATHNKYWQGLRTHSVIPSEGNTSLPDIGSACPPQQPGQPWPDAVLNTALEMALWIDVYDGPQGTGYQATVVVSVLGNLYTRTAQVGPETWRTSGWTQVTTAGLQ